MHGVNNLGGATIPYIESKSRPYFDEHPEEAKTEGDLAYVFYKFFLAKWKAEPRWATYARIRASLKQVERDVDLKKLVAGLSKNGADLVTMVVAAECAIEELKRRYVDEYEDKKRTENGEIE